MNKFKLKQMRPIGMGSLVDFLKDAEIPENALIESENPKYWIVDLKMCSNIKEYNNFVKRLIPPEASSMEYINKDDLIQIHVE